MRYKALLIDNDETLMDFHAAEGNAIAQVNAFLGIDDPSAREHILPSMRSAGSIMRRAKLRKKK